MALTVSYRPYHKGLSLVVPGRIVWKVRLLERHGIENLTLPDGNVVSLICEQRKSADEKPVVHVTSTRPIEVKVEQ